LVNTANGNCAQAYEPLEALKAIDDLPKKTIVLDVLKTWLLKRKDAFTRRALTTACPLPRAC